MNDNTINERIGFEMRSQRLLKRMTLEQVATAMGIASRNTISYWELGKTGITVEDLVKYCEVVGCSYIDVLEAATKEKG